MSIAPEAVDPDDVAMLEDLVLAALHDVNAQLAEIQREAMGPLGGLLGGRLSAPMANVYAAPVQDLIDELGRLPGVGPKSAQRIAFHLLKLPSRRRPPAGPRHHRGQGPGGVLPALLQHRRGRRAASSAPTTGATPPSSASSRSPGTSSAVEKTQEFQGRYHVLQGAISPIEGVGPDQLRIRELLARIEREGVAEVILCTNPNLEGEATAMYLGRLLKALDVKVTRIASGLPVGGDLEYADELTLGRALEGRREVD